MESVYSAVRTGSLNKAVCSLCHLQHKLIGFITEMKSVYSAVRTGYLNKAVCDLCQLQHKLIGFYNRDEKCLQRGTDLAFKQSGLRFAFKVFKCLLCFGFP
jgi:hypothetical protein